MMLCPTIESAAVFSRSLGATHTHSSLGRACNASTGQRNSYSTIVVPFFLLDDFDLSTVFGDVLATLTSLINDAASYVYKKQRTSDHA
jgi:hypothetical protein